MNRHILSGNDSRHMYDAYFGNAWIHCFGLFRIAVVVGHKMTDESRV